MSLLEKAITFAVEAHQGKDDPDGNPSAAGTSRIHDHSSASLGVTFGLMCSTPMLT
jgi:hypothetical protein